MTQNTSLVAGTKRDLSPFRESLQSPSKFVLHEWTQIPYLQYHITQNHMLQPYHMSHYKQHQENQNMIPNSS